MQLHREGILALIAAEPGLRTVQIADKIGCEIDAVEVSIEAELANGAVVKREVVAPNKRKASAFWMGEVAAADPVTRPRTKVEVAIDFIRGKPEQIATSADLHRELGLLGHELPSSILADALADGRLLKEGKFWTVGGDKPAATEPAADATNAPKAAMPTAETADSIGELPSGLVSQLSKKAQAGLQRSLARVDTESQDQGPAPAVTQEANTKAQLALDYIRSRPNQMATASELRVVMGIRTNQYPDPWLANLREKGEVHKDGHFWKLGPRRTITDQERDHVRDVLNGDFRCALWSSGELSLARGERTVMQLSATEAEQLAAYLASARAAA